MLPIQCACTQNIFSHTHIHTASRRQAKEMWLVVMRTRTSRKPRLQCLPWTSLPLGRGPRAWMPPRPFFNLRMCQTGRLNNIFGSIHCLHVPCTAPTVGVNRAVSAFVLWINHQKRWRGRSIQLKGFLKVITHVTLSRLVIARLILDFSRKGGKYARMSAYGQA